MTRVYRDWRRKLSATVCFFALTAAAAAPQSPSVPGWRLLRNTNPAGGRDAVALTRAADISSDLDLAGLMLRCHDGRAEVAVVVVNPFSPRAHPLVTLAASGREWRFEATIVPPGAELLLPADAAVLAAGPWQSANQLAVNISWQSTVIKGAIPIDGLANAFVTLMANCPSG